MLKEPNTPSIGTTTYSHFHNPINTNSKVKHHKLIPAT
uniref:Uncharacterized protein n=1 Tax=Rhizophora mucronata TaxID=61149 RepID=A0A2P2IP07_RHIMU